jgi:hypothetical protein
MPKGIAGKVQASRSLDYSDSARRLAPWEINSAIGRMVIALTEDVYRRGTLVDWTTLTVETKQAKNQTAIWTTRVSVEEKS